MRIQKNRFKLEHQMCLFTKIIVTNLNDQVSIRQEYSFYWPFSRNKWHLEHMQNLRESSDHAKKRVITRSMTGKKKIFFSMIYFTGSEQMLIYYEKEMQERQQMKCDELLRKDKHEVKQIQSSCVLICHHSQYK